MKVSSKLHASPVLFSGKPPEPLKRSWVGPRSILDFCKTEKFVFSAGIQTPDLPAHSLGTILNSSSSSPECYREDKNFSHLLRIEQNSLFSTL
jgi:hypothetical protein